MNSTLINRPAFIKLLTERFPDVITQFDEYSVGLLHLEVATLRRAAEKAADDGHLWEFERFFRFVEELLPNADAALKNALEVSFVEDFALEYTKERHDALRKRGSREMQEMMSQIDSRWR